MQKSAFYRFPYQITSYDWESNLNTGFLTLIDNALNNDGYCVIQLDALDFADANGITNTTRIQQLTNLLTAVKAANYTTVPIKRYL